MGNFDKLPKDVLKVLLESLDPQTLLNICTTNKAFTKFCSSNKAIGILDRKALEYISENAPLAAPVRSLSEQASLIKRGFCTTYYTNIFWRTGWKSGEVHFGFKPNPIGEYPGTRVCFSIIGMPPREGTPVWLAIVRDEEPDHDDILEAEVFESPEEAVEHFSQYEKLTPEEKKIIMIGASIRDLEQYIVVSVVLP